jgi:histone-lysine N-methyltransferase SUV39H
VSSPYVWLVLVNLSHRRRGKIQERWRKAARREHAALISIVNEVDEDEIPNIGEGFTYCERKYVL